MKKIVLVGHCGVDSYALEDAVARALGHEADVITVNDRETLDLLMDQAGLLLVNRVLDGKFGTGDGIELIRQLAETDYPPTMMLISNYRDAQEQAVRAGARPGFGKLQLNDRATAQLLRSAIPAGV